MVVIGVVQLLVAIPLLSLAQSDTTAPQLTAFSFTPSTIDTTAGPATLTVNFSLTDDLAGARR